MILTIILQTYHLLQTIFLLAIIWPMKTGDKMYQNFHLQPTAYVVSPVRSFHIRVGYCHLICLIYLSVSPEYTTGYLFNIVMR